MDPTSPKASLQTLELWLDCRASGTEVNLVPLSCDRRLVLSGASLRRHDLSISASSGKAFDDRGFCVGSLLDGAYACVPSSSTPESLAVWTHALDASLGDAEWLLLQTYDAFLPSEALLTFLCTRWKRLAVFVSDERHLLKLEPLLPRLGALIILCDGHSTLWQKAVVARLAIERADLQPVETVRGGHSLPPVEDLKEGVVESLRVVDGFADGVRLDFIQMLREGEGVLVGSTANFMCFVHGETVAAHPNSRPRPFRVCPGPVHACIALPDGRTKYSSEVNVGEEILVVGAPTTGLRSFATSRNIAVGRCHIESCAVVCMQLTYLQSRSQLFLEHSAAVRLHAKRLGGDFEPVPVTELQHGDSVLIHWVG